MSTLRRGCEDLLHTLKAGPAGDTMTGSEGVPTCGLAIALLATLVA
jgi:hypothetical protein